MNVRVRPTDFVTPLGSGETPLIASRSLGRLLELESLAFKVECCQPPGSWLDRSAQALVAAAVAEGRTGLCTIGVHAWTVPLAMQCARAGLRFVVLEPATEFLLNFNEEEFTTAVRARDYYSFVALTTIAMGLLFQVPIVVLALTRLGITTPQKLRHFVADPAQGSRHNRGCAVDLTLYDLRTGQPVEMPGGYDEFSHRSSPDYPGGTTRQRWHRDLLRRVMEAEGFTVYPQEWWHFDYRDWRSYRIGNQPFELVPD